MGTYKLSSEAQNDLIRIHQRGLREFGETQADKYFYELIRRFEKIADNPLLYPAVEDIREHYRRSVCGVDSIYYRIADEGIEIMAIIGRQDAEGWL